MQHGPGVITTDKGSSTFAGWLASRPLLTELSLVALTVLFGMQTLRVLIPGLFWVLGGRMGWGAIELGGIGLLVFLTAFLAGSLRRLFGGQHLIIVTAGGLAVLRFAMQIWWGEPLFNLILAMLGTALFVIFLPAYIESARLRGRPAISHFTIGLLIGLTLDTAIQGAFSTYDIVWQVTLLPVLLTLLLVVAQCILLANLLKTSATSTTISPDITADGIPVSASLPVLAIGPFLFLQLVVFQNIPLVTTLTGWMLPAVYGCILLAHLAGLAAATWLISRMRRTPWLWALSCGIGLVVILTLYYQQTAALTGLLLLIGQILLSLLIVIILTGITVNTGKTHRSGITVANGIGMILLLVFILAYYAVYDISLPYTNIILEPIAAFLVAICALSVSVTAFQKISVDRKIWAVPAITLLLLIPPVAGVVTWQTPAATPGEGFPIRIMTYNLHNGFNTNGHLDIESIAQVIEDSDANIIALQEVCRGWVVNGRVDMLTWLSQRLDMPYVFGPTDGYIWGNAILSRYPITESSQHKLPPRDLFLLRGFTSTLIDMGNGNQLQVIVTHFHHLEGDTDIRQLQSQTILDFWDSAGKTVLLGDFNANLNDREMEMFRQAGLVDTASTTGGTPACTYSSTNPHKRIDYIWASPDLKVIDFQVPVSTASDHLPVIAVIDKRN